MKRKEDDIHETKMKVNRLSEEEQHFQREMSEAWIKETLGTGRDGEGKDANLFAPLEAIPYELWVSRNESDVFFRIRFEGAVQASCVRCLEEIEQPIAVELGGVFCIPQEDDDDEALDPSHYFYDGESIDFSPVLQEHIFLNLPPHPTCGGVGKHCNDSFLAQYNTDGAAFDKLVKKESEGPDPRWAALAKIKENIES